MTKKITVVVAIIFTVSLIGLMISVFASGEGKIFKTYEVDTEQAYSLDDVTKVSISSGSADITFILTDEENEIRVKYYGKVVGFVCSRISELEHEKKDNTVKISTERKGVDVSIGKTTQLKLDVYLPNSYDEDLIISSASGDLKIDDLTLKNFTYNTSSGDGKINNLTLKSGRIVTASGDIDINGLSSDEEFVIRTASGDITIANITADIDYTSSSGDLEISNLSGNFTGKTSSGEIELEVVSEDYIINIISSSGDIDLDILEKDFQFSITTSSGDIWLHFEYTVVGTFTDHFKSGRVGTGKNTVTITTSSGDVDIR